MHVVTAVVTDEANLKFYLLIDDVISVLWEHLCESGVESLRKSYI